MSSSAFQMAILPVIILVGAAALVTGQTTFVLNTRQNPSSATTIDITSDRGLARIRQSKFSASRPTKILIHGYGDSYNKAWWTNIADAFLDTEDVNVIRLDWAKSSAKNAGYNKGVAATLTVGREVANAIQYLISELGVAPADVHVIGHSLGAHTAGAVGAALKSQRIVIGRVTGLDPAGPGFNSAAASARLDITDAEVVDTMMTNAGVLGTTQALGHLNFLPNGGRLQPGCSRILPVCSHAKAMSFFADSIRDKNRITGTQCSDYESFKQGKCRGNAQALMGYRTDLRAAGRNPIKFYS